MGRRIDAQHHRDALAALPPRPADRDRVAGMIVELVGRGRRCRRQTGQAGRGRDRGRAPHLTRSCLRPGRLPTRAHRDASADGVVGGTGVRPTRGFRLPDLFSAQPGVARGACGRGVHEHHCENRDRQFLARSHACSLPFFRRQRRCSTTALSDTAQPIHWTGPTCRLFLCLQWTCLTWVVCWTVSRPALQTWGSRPPVPLAGGEGFDPFSRATKGRIWARVFARVCQLQWQISQHLPCKP